MKTAAQMFCGTLLSALAMNSAFAEPVTVKVTGQVTSWRDSGALGGQVVVGQPITATYSYDTTTPDLDASPTFGLYRPTAANGASVRVEVGALVFESLPTSQFEAVVSVVQPPPNVSGFWVFQSFQNKPLDNGAPVDWIAFGFRDDGTVITSDALPTTAPDLQAFPYRELFVNSAQMEVRMNITSAELVPASIEISPSAGRFLDQQRFDAAVLLPVGAQVSGMQVTLTDGSVLHNYVSWSRSP